MKRVWKITLYEVKDGYKAVIEGEGGYAEGKSKTAYGAYAYAESKLVVKPGFVDVLKHEVKAMSTERLRTAAFPAVTLGVKVEAVKLSDALREIDGGGER